MVRSTHRAAICEEAIVAKGSRRKNQLSGMPAELWNGLLALSQQVNLEPKQPLFHAGDAGDGCYAVQSGALKATVNDPNGHERMLAVFSSGMIVGEMSLFDEEPRSATVTAIRKSKLSYLPRDVFYRYADKNPEAYRFALRSLAQRLRTSNDDTLAQGNASVQAKVARAMLSLAESLGDPSSQMIAQRVTQFDIAAMAGVARENANRCINQWKRQGILEKKGFYKVLDRAALVRIING
jgi:CRP/FNR family transcriptional regulator, cyclic AMP receptor protein